jgi:murein DD-endopeptidase MepM/ murein hydrolase activator NlpD
MRHAVLLAFPLLLVARCEPTCAPPPPPPRRYTVPVAGLAEWGDTHAEYPASDIFAGCGAAIVSPVDGVVVESRRVNAYDPAVDNPATRGGRSVSIVGDDGVRYYMAHLETIDEGIEPGTRVAMGQSLGRMGSTGRASACHLHFGISPPCPGKEWSVRRGVVWPQRYLNDWRAGGRRSPVDEVNGWTAVNRDACAQAMADPHAADA